MSLTHQAHAQESQASAQSASSHASNTQLPPRLPCRGCLPTCSNYATCDGKPWRELGQAHSIKH